MTNKQYISLVVTVVLLGAAAYFSQKTFIQGRALDELPRGVAFDIASSTTPASRGGDTSLREESPPRESSLEMLGVTIIAEDKKYEIDTRDGMSAYEAMRAASASGFTFSGREYPSLGFFVEAINGAKAPAGYYWIFYLNGKQSQTGISQTPVSAGDMIEWRLDSAY